MEYDYKNIWSHFARISGGFATSFIVSRTFVGRRFWSVDWRATRIEPGKIAKAEFLRATTIERTTVESAPDSRDEPIHIST